MTDDGQVPYFEVVFRQHARKLRDHLEHYVDVRRAGYIAGQAFAELFMFACHDEPTRWGTYQRLYASTEFMLRRTRERAGTYLPASYSRTFPLPCRLELCQLAGAYSAVAAAAALAKLDHEDRVDAAAGIAAVVEQDLYVGAVWYGHGDMQQAGHVLQRMVAAADAHRCDGLEVCTHGASTWEREDVRSQIWRTRTLGQRRYQEDGCCHEVHHPHHPDAARRDDRVERDGSVRVVEPEHGVGSDGELAADLGGDA